jgi:hypothetical protein
MGIDASLSLSHYDSQLELIIRELRRTKYHVDVSDETLAEEIEVLLRVQTQGLKISQEALQKLADRLDLRSSEAVTQEIMVLLQSTDFDKKLAGVPGEVEDGKVDLFFVLFCFKKKKKNCFCKW